MLEFGEGILLLAEFPFVWPGLVSKPLSSGLTYPGAGIFRCASPNPAFWKHPSPVFLVLASQQQSQTASVFN